MTDEIERIHDYLSGEATDEEARRLEAWMRQDTRHVDLFVREAFLHRELHEVLRETVADSPMLDDDGLSSADRSGRTALGVAPSVSTDTGAMLGDDLDADPLSDPNARQGSSLYYVWGGGVQSWLVPLLTVLIAVGAACWFVRAPGQGSPDAADFVAGVSPGETPDIRTAEAVATVVEGEGCVWGDSSEFARGSGTRVSPGQVVSLVSGKAKVHFDCGATVTLTGPGLLAVDTRMDATLLRGDVSVSVPEEAIGFLVHTDEMDVRDLGTEFKLNVDDAGQTSVEVVDGKVEAQLADEKSGGPSKHSLGVGEYLRTGRPEDASRDVAEDWTPARLSVFRGVRVDFSTPQSLRLLTILNENTDRYRFDAARGCLSVDTTWGNVFAKQKLGENLFLLPAPKDGDFDVVLSLAKFVPERLCEHVALLAMDDKDNYARIIYARHRIQQRCYVQFNVEKDGEPGSRAFDPVEFGAGPFQLRLVRRGDEISGWWSRDGKHWTLRDRGKTPNVIRYVGFYASKGYSYPKDGTPFQQAQIEKFEIEIKDSPNGSTPAATDTRPIQ